MLGMVDTNKTVRNVALTCIQLCKLIDDTLQPLIRLLLTFGQLLLPFSERLPSSVC